MAKVTVGEKVLELIITFCKKHEGITEGSVPNGIMAEVNGLFVAGLADFFTLCERKQKEFMASLGEAHKSVFTWLIQTVLNLRADLRPLCRV